MLASQPFTHKNLSLSICHSLRTGDHINQDNLPMNFRSLIAIAPILLATAAQAEMITLSFSGVQFAGGTTAAGSYVYDTVTLSMSDIQIDLVAPNATVERQLRYSCEARCQPNAQSVIDQPTRPDLTGVNVLKFNHGRDFTGGLLAYIALYGTCADANCVSTINTRGPVTYAVPLIRH